MNLISFAMVTISVSVYFSFIVPMLYTFWKLKFLKRSCNSLLTEAVQVVAIFTKYLATSCKVTLVTFHPDCLTSLIKRKLDSFVYPTDTVQVVSILPKQNTRQPLAKASQTFSHCNLLETEMALHNDLI